VNRLTYGYTAGVGSEVMLTGNVFARAEYEFVRLVRPIEVNVNTIRGGLGYKF
jgi:opacity protein-like surface antigen